MLDGMEQTHRDKVAAVRRKKRYSQKRVATHLGIKDQETISRWERGKDVLTTGQEMEYIRFLGFEQFEDLLMYDLDEPLIWRQEAGGTESEHVRTREYIAHLEDEIRFLRELVRRKDPGSK